MWGHEDTFQSAMPVFCAICGLWFLDLLMPRFVQGPQGPVSWIKNPWKSIKNNKAPKSRVRIQYVDSQLCRRLFLSKLDILGSLAMTASPTLRSPVFKMFLILPATARLAFYQLVNAVFYPLPQQHLFGCYALFEDWCGDYLFFYSRCILKQDLWDLNRNFLAL